MPNTFQVIGNLADFGDHPRVGVEVLAVASPRIKKSDTSIHSNEPESATTNSTGDFVLTLISVPGVWYRLQTSNFASAINTVNLAGYVPDSEDPTTGTEFPALTVINLADVMDEDPTPGYDGIFVGGGDGGVTVHSALTGRTAADQHPTSAITGLDAALAGKATAAQGAKADTAVQPADLTAYATDAELTAGLATKAATSHSHATADVTGLDAALSAAATDADLTAHAAGTTGVHGIADTAALVLTSDARLSDARTPTTHTHDDRYFTETEADGRFVRTVNGTGPDGSGNVTVAGGGGGVTDHGALTGLADDDHTLYALADGTRGSFASVTQGAKADTAVQPADLTAYATDAELSAGLSGKADTLGADDNYVTDAEKVKLSNLSGTNTGDQTLPTWTTIAGKPAVVAEGATQADARTAIGAGTSSLVIGTGAGDAKAGNYQPTAANISDSTTTGRALLTAVDAAAARTSLGLGTAATTASTAYATAAQGAKADTALQAAHLAADDHPQYVLRLEDFSAAGATGRIGKHTINYATTGASPTMFEVWYAGGSTDSNLATFWLNENGAPRAAMPKPLDTALKVIGWGTGQTGATFSVEQRSGDGTGGRSHQWGINAAGKQIIGPNEVVAESVVVIESTDSAPPAGTPTGTVVFKKRA